MPTILDWPTTRPFLGARFSLALDVSEAAGGGFYTGNRTYRSSLADRMLCTVTLPPCTAIDAGVREGYLFALRSQRLWMRFGMPHRRIPVGTLRGTPTATSPAAAGALTMAITAAPNVTLLPGDFLAVGTNTLLMIGPPGATANGSGAMPSVPLAMPLPVSVAGAAALIWDSPKGLWEIDADQVQMDYSAPVIQEGVAIPFRQVIQA